MSNNTVLSAGSGGDTITTVDQSQSSFPTTGKMPASLLYQGAAADSLAPLSAANPLPVQLSDGSAAIALGQALVAASLPVVLPASQMATLTPLATVSTTATDGSNVTLGTTTDSSSASSLVGLLKAIKASVAGTLTATLAAGTALIGAVAAALRTDAIMSGTTALTPKFAHATLSATGEVVGVVTGKKIRVLRYSLMADAACSVSLKSSTAGQISGTKYISATGGAGGGFCPVGHCETVAGEALDLTITGSANVSIDVTYLEI